MVMGTESATVEYHFHLEIDQSDGVTSMKG